jgi:hypothetical protein
MGVEVIPRLTYEDFRQLPDDSKRYELIHGRVHLSPAPSVRHQFVAGNPYRSLGPFVVKNHLGELLVAPVDVRLSEDTALHPDLVFVSRQRLEIIQEISSPEPRTSWWKYCLPRRLRTTAQRNSTCTLKRESLRYG